MMNSLPRFCQSMSTYSCSQCDCLCTAVAQNLLSELFNVDGSRLEVFSVCCGISLVFRGQGPNLQNFLRTFVKSS